MEHMGYMLSGQQGQSSDFIDDIWLIFIYFLGNICIFT